MVTDKQVTGQETAQLHPTLRFRRNLRHGISRPQLKEVEWFEKQSVEIKTIITSVPPIRQSLSSRF